MVLIDKEFHVAGMICVNCRSRIERELKQTQGVQKADVDYATGLAHIVFDAERLSDRNIREIIEGLGYEVGEDGSKEWLRNILGLLCIFVLYILLQQSGVLNLLVPSQLADGGMGYGMLFMVGLFTSVHCVAMCGGINLSQSLSSDKGGSTLLPSTLYNFGRVLSYTATGFLLGLAGFLLGGGKGFGISAFAQGILKLAAGLVMIIMGLNMLGIFPRLRRFAPRLPRSNLVTRMRIHYVRPLVVGLLNGLMPCGPLQSMQIIALASGHPVTGALSMLSFSLGTVPLMLGLGAFISAFGKRFTKDFMYVGPMLVTVLGLTMLSQGGSLSGLFTPDKLLLALIALASLGMFVSVPFTQKDYRWIRLTGICAVVAVIVLMGYYWGGQDIVADESNTSARMVDGIQIVKSTLDAGKYPNITIKAGVPVQWIINAPEGSINGCNYKMLIEAYGIEHVFQPGENVIEFTPIQAGRVQYNCWMGMINGNIVVTES